MKKLNLKQMEKVNGGRASERRCNRIMGRSGRQAARGNLGRGDELTDKWESLGCDGYR